MASGAGGGAAEWHAAALVWDAHADTVLAWDRGRPFATRTAQGHVDLPRLRDGGVKVQIFALFVEPAYPPEQALARTLHLWDVLRQAIVEAAGQARLCRTAAEVDTAIAAGVLAVIASVEGGEALGTDLRLLRVLHALGVRAMGLTWNGRNAIASGAGDESGGLTAFGRDVVCEMFRLGMVVDVSHLNRRSFWDALAAARGPVIASHSNARALCDHPRNLADDQIRALAASGGVMGMNFYPRFLASSPERADLGRVCDHIDHICGLVGPAHVGLGSDFDGIAGVPRGLEDCSRLPALTAELLRRGYRRQDVRAILGGNFRRVFQEVWGAAQG